MSKTIDEEIDELEKKLGQQSLLRSEDMSLLHFYIPSEIGHLTVRKLGQLGVIQFNDVSIFVLYFFFFKYYYDFNYLQLFIMNI